MGDPANFYAIGSFAPLTKVTSTVTLTALDPNALKSKADIFHKCFGTVINLPGSKYQINTPVTWFWSIKTNSP